MKTIITIVLLITSISLASAKEKFTFTKQIKQKVHTYKFHLRWNATQEELMMFQKMLGVVEKDNKNMYIYGNSTVFALNKWCTKNKVECPFGGTTLYLPQLKVLEKQYYAK